MAIDVVLHVASGEHARHVGVALGVDDDFTELRQLDARDDQRSAEPRAADSDAAIDILDAMAEPAALVWAAQMGTLTFHPWPVRRPDVDHPDELRIDLDPQPGTTFADVQRVARTYAEVVGGTAGPDRRRRAPGAQALQKRGGPCRKPRGSRQP